jgi:putative membrane protein
MWQEIAYCGLPPVPGGLWGRFNLDPILILALGALAFLHLAWCRGNGHRGRAPLTGWAIVAACLLSPLCALSVSLFAARVAQHMILLLVAAPLIASGLPRPDRGSRGLWPAATAFLAALWLWHMPVPYDATLRSTPLYWAMHTSLFGSGLWLWRELIGHDARDTPNVLAASIATTVQMGLLGAILTLGNHAWFSVHYLTTQAWGLTPLEDQQLGGVLMWVPGCLLLLWAALRSFHRAWRVMESGQLA